MCALWCFCHVIGVIFAVRCLKLAQHSSLSLHTHTHTQKKTKYLPYDFFFMEISHPIPQHLPISANDITTEISIGMEKFTEKIKYFDSLRIVCILTVKTEEMYKDSRTEIAMCLDYICSIKTKLICSLRFIELASIRRNLSSSIKLIMSLGMHTRTTWYFKWLLFDTNVNTEQTRDDNESRK